MYDATFSADLQKISQAAWLLLARYSSLTTDEERRGFVLSLAPWPEDFRCVFREDSAEFPGGYQDVLLHYRAETVLLCWEYLPPDSGAGLSFAGLVSIDDRWAWLPKPWRVLPNKAAPLQHWLD